MKKYTSSRRGRDTNLYALVTKGLQEGYKFGKIKETSLINKTGKVRSDIRILKEMAFGKNGDSLFDRTYDLVVIQKKSLSEASRIISQDTAKYHLNGEMMETSSKQLKKILAERDCITPRDYKKDPEKYDTLSGYTIYGKNAVFSFGDHFK